MVKLIVFDDVDYTENRNGEEHARFREALRQLNPHPPFLIRGVLGDWDYNAAARKVITKPTFRGKELQSLLLDVLVNGHDRIKDEEKVTVLDPDRKPHELKFKYVGARDMIWACHYDCIDRALPYLLDDDIGCMPQGHMNQLALVIDPALYTRDQPTVYFQEDPAKRVRALLGIVLRDANHAKSPVMHSPTSFELTPGNVDETVRQIKQKGYFS